MTLKDIHDELLAKMPEGAEHQEAECAFCMSEVASDPDNNGGTMSDKTFTEDEVKVAVTAAVAEAVKPLQDKIASHEAASTEAEVDAKITAVREELEAQVAEIQLALDASTLDKEAAIVARDELVAFLDGEKAKADEEAETAKLRVERTAEVAKVASFPDDYIKANEERWSKMDDDAFVALLEDYKTFSANKPGSTLVPATTTLNASREENTDKGVLHEVLTMRFSGIDPRAV